MRSREFISVIVPVRDDLTVLRRSLPRIVAAVESYSNAELIVVDNGSEDGTYEWLINNYTDSVVTLKLPDASVGAVRNHGARRARGDVLCFVDADCLVEPDHLTNVYQALKETSAAAVGSRYLLPSDPTWVESTWHQLHRRGRKERVSFLSAGNIAIKADVFREIGGFDDHLVTGEDAELCHRLIDQGHAICHHPIIEVIHLGNPKTVTGFFRKQRWYALGMFGTVSVSSVDKPFVATVAHVVLIALSIGIAFTSFLDWAATILVMSLAVTIVPLVAVAFRWHQVGRVVNPLQALILYEVFFAARIMAAGLLLFGAKSGWRPGREGGMVSASPSSGPTEGH